MNLNSFFDKIYCINMDIHKDRWKKCTTLFDKFNIKAERFPGCIYKKDYVNGKITPGINRKAEIGCTLSHLSILKKARDLNYNNVFIFEDDIIFDKDFEKYLSYLNKVPENWDMIYLGWYDNYTKKNTHIKIRKNLYKLKYVFCAHSYGVNKKIFDELLKIDPVNDVIIDRIYAEKIQLKYNCYGIGKISKKNNFCGIICQERENIKSVIRLEDVESGITEQLQGDDFFYGTNNKKKNLKNAFQYWLKGAKKGNLQCMKNLIHAYKNKAGTGNNYFLLKYWELKSKITEEKYKKFSLTGIRISKNINEIIKNKWILVNKQNDIGYGTYLIKRKNKFIIHHKKWGYHNLWLINAGNFIKVLKNNKIFVCFKIINNSKNPVKSVKIGFLKDLKRNKKDFIQLLDIKKDFIYIKKEIKYSKNIEGAFAIKIEFYEKYEDEMVLLIKYKNKIYSIN